MRRGVVATLRDFVPIRPLTREEALRIAELQAHRFHELEGLSAPPFPESLIAGLPRVQIERLSPIPVSGSAHWASNRWLIVLNGAEPTVRQRFSLAHEFKHILDHRFVDVLYSGVGPEDRSRWIEQTCDFFAACLLMPRAWVKRSYTTGSQRLPQLALRFAVSQAAMQVRLTQIGLVDRPDRCSRVHPDWTLRANRVAGTPFSYQRPAAPIHDNRCLTAHRTDAAPNLVGAADGAV
jgi:IrrE N-terminal-like domain